MRVVLMSLVRLIALLMVVATMAALAVAWCVPEPTGAPRSPIAGLGAINSIHGPLRDALWVLDGNAGAVTGVDLPEGERIDLVAAAPWSDDAGQAQLIGRWRRRRWMAGPQVDLGLARVRYPSGQVLDRLPVGVSMLDAPCWAPDGSSRAIVPLADGRLYLWAFDRDATEAGPSALVPIDWAIPLPGEGRVDLTGPCWPTDLRFRGKLVVSLVSQARVAGRLTTLDAQLWWIELDPQARRIVGAGPLAPTPGPRSRRSPTPIRRPDGSIALAYLTIERGPRHDLRLAPITFDPDTGAPTLDLARERLLAEDCLLPGICVSPDGRGLTCMVRSRDGVPTPTRFPLGPIDDAVTLLTASRDPDSDPHHAR